MITKSKTQAIKLATRLLRKELNVKYIKGKYVEPISTMCNCGETQAVLVAGRNMNGYQHKVVGYCKYCCEE